MTIVTKIRLPLSHKDTKKTTNDEQVLFWYALCLGSLVVLP